MCGTPIRVLDLEPETLNPNHRWVTGQTRPQFFVDEVAVFNPASKKASTVAPLLEKRGNAQLVALPGDRLMLVGGRSYVISQAVVRSFSHFPES